MAVEKTGTNIFKFSALVALSAVLAVVTVVLGALPLLPARRVGGRWLFWLVQLAIVVGLAAVGLPFYGLIILAQTLVIGVYVEVEEHGGTVFTSGAIAVLAAIGTTVLAGGLWLHLTKLRLGDELRAQIDPMIAQLTSLNSNSAVFTTETVIQQLPSAAVIALILALAIALIAERRLSNALKVRDAATSLDPGTSREKLVAFRIPDVFVWAVVLAIAGAFMKHGRPVIELISVNLLNVLVVLYFFQGLAVVAQAFRVFKVNAVWQAIWYVLLVMQLFLMVSLLGFADYWLEFRQRLNRKPVDANRSF